MSDSTANITVPANDWVDLYALSGFTVGTPLVAVNIGVCDVYLAVQATKPLPGHDAYVISFRNGGPLRNSSGDSGAWAFCQGGAAKLSVRCAR